MFRAIIKVPNVYRAVACKASSPRVVPGFTSFRFLCTQTSAEEGVYEGPRIDGLRHGMGKLITPAGVTFEGSFVNGVRTGFGKSVTADGIQYEGQWVQDKPHGSGKLTLPDGTVFKGNFNMGVMQGSGQKTTPDGTIQTGTWENNVFQHNWKTATMLPPAKDVAPKAERAKQPAVAVNMTSSMAKGNEKPTRIRSRKETTIPSSVQSVASYRKEPTSRGASASAAAPAVAAPAPVVAPALKKAAGYDGPYKNGKRHGRGSLVYANGSVYEGEFAENQLHGKGVLTLPDGTQFHGTWVHGEHWGAGHIMFPNGRKFVGVYEGDDVLPATAVGFGSFFASAE